MSDIRMFLRIEPQPPTVTHQQQKTVVRNGKPFRYEEPRLKEARALYRSLLAPHRPEKPMRGPLAVDAKWIFHRPSSAKGMFKTTRPDCDNLMKLVQDCMTELGYWNDDSQIVSLQVQKLWGGDDIEHGIYLKIEEIEG